MDQKEIKSMLKAIKESLDQKDYKTALKQCKTILRVDRNNYLALVFYGAAVQETEQKDEAPKAFKKAIEISPDHLLAWRGLAAFYEKHEEENSDLLDVYSRLLLLETDDTKLPEILGKFEKLSVSANNTAHLKMIYDSLSQCSDQKQLILQKFIITMLSIKANICEDYLLNFQNIIEDLFVKKPKIENFADLLKLFLKVLFKEKKFKQLFTEATEFIELYPHDVSLLEWICKAFTELPQEDFQDLINYCPKKAYSTLIENNLESYLAYYCKGTFEFYSGDFLSASDSFKEALRLEPTAGSLWLKLCMSQMLLFRFSEAEESLLKAMNFFKKDDQKLLLCKIKLLQCLIEQNIKEKLCDGEKLAEALLKENPENMEVLQYLIVAKAKLEKFDEAEEKLQILGQNEEHTLILKYLKCVILKQKNKIEELKNMLKEIVKDTPDDFKAWLELGKIYYNEKNYNSCLNSLLKSAKLNQWCCWSFLFLGHCYRNMMQEYEKARRCYQKAFQLNPLCAEAGINLSDVYRILRKEDLNVQLLSAITAMNPQSKWAWLKLGLHYLSVNNYQKAVDSLRVAVRLDTNQENAWECLGDAYHAQGAYTSALKSYLKVQELNADSIYAMLQIATVKHLLGFFNESIQEFKLIINRIPDYIPALKGHSEACLSLMKHYLSQNLNGLAHDSCQEAVTSLMKCLKQSRYLICIWKLLGNACTLLSSLPEKYCKLELSFSLFSNKQAHSESEIILNKYQILKLGSRSFCHAIALNPNFSTLWYDLSIIYNSLVEVSKTEESKKSFRNLACSAVKKSILLDDNSWESWNLYGVILASAEIQNYQLAQHCFIKAILKNDTNAITWTNLGTLYLGLDDLQIANLSFTEAQRYDHDYVFCWVGQAIIAQKTGHHDAMDLYRHSTQLGFSSEGCLGYSNLVCLTLLNTKNKNDKNYLYSIKNMNAVTVAGNALTWFTDRFPNNAWAWNMLGLLLERQMLYKTSSDAFFQALKIKQSEVLQNKVDDHFDTVDKILLNYSRVLSHLKRSEEAIENLKQIKKATFTNQCELAAAYFRVHLYEEAYCSYETTLEWLASDTKLKSHILVAMAAVVYLHQGQEDAKILLMQSCQLKPPSVEGLFALCALGMLHSDLALSELAIRELNQYKDDVQYLGHIAVFQAYIYLFQGQKKKAIRALCEVIHRHPNQPSVWHSLSLLLLHLYPSFDSRCAARCAEVSLITGRSSIDVSKVMSLVSLSHLLSDEGLRSLKSAQKAVHIFPDVTENWVVLVASVLSKCLVRQSAEEIFWLKKMITYIRRKFESSKPMTQWLSSNNRKITMMAEKMGYGVPDIEIEASYFNLEYFIT